MWKTGSLSMFERHYTGLSSSFCSVAVHFQPAGVRPASARHQLLLPLFSQPPTHLWLGSISQLSPGRRPHQSSGMVRIQFTHIHVQYLLSTSLQGRFHPLPSLQLYIFPVSLVTSIKLNSFLHPCNELKSVWHPSHSRFSSSFFSG